jgi:hypothetical protein
VSIVTPSYNQARFLGQAIESVLSQDYPDIEYLVLDGGSTDGSVEILRTHEDRIDYWASGPDAGQADAINHGWQRSRGEILAWLNSDDLYKAGAISAVVEAFQRHPRVDVVTGDCQVIDESGQFIRQLPSAEFDIEAILSGNSLPQQGVFCRRQAVEAAGWLEANLDYVFDWALWLRLGLRGARFRHLPRVVASFRVWGDSKTASETVGASLSGGLPFARERFRVLSQLAQDPGPLDSPALREYLHEAWLGAMLELALLYQISGKEEKAGAYLAQFTHERRGSQDPLPHPRALATHLAYMDGDIDSVLEPLTRKFVAAQGQRNSQAALMRWLRELRGETELVRAWHATQVLDDLGASRHFRKAISANPALLLQRRAASPAARYALRAIAQRLSARGGQGPAV